MRYLTAQLVSSPRFARFGVNAFVHHHSEGLEMGLEPFSYVDRIARDPGQLVVSHIELPPGGNTVLAFLDVLAPDDADDFEALLQQARGSLQGRSNELAAELSGGYFRFYAGAVQELSQTFDALAEGVRAAVSSPQPMPLIARVQSEPDAMVVRLDRDSVLRLQALHGAEWVGAGVRLAPDTAADFERIHGSIVPHLVEVLTGLPRDNARALGGVKFVRPDGSETTWPE